MKQINNPCLGRLGFSQLPVERVHLGHLVGIITPILQLQPTYEMVILIADGPPGSHGPLRLKEVYEVACAWLSAGLSPSETLLARLSDIPEIKTLSSILTPYVTSNQTLPTLIYHQACGLIGVQATHTPAHPAQRVIQSLAASISGAYNQRASKKIPEAAWLPLREDTLPGLNGKAMDATNAIFLEDSEERTYARLAKMPDTPQAHAILRAIHSWLIAPSDADQETAIPTEKAGRYMGELVNEYLHSLRVKRQKWLVAPNELEGILQFGSLRVRRVIGDTVDMIQHGMAGG
jgi:tryptophanyl-tRNA synthetase